MKKGLVILVIMVIVVLGFIQDRNHNKAPVTWTNAQIAKQYLIGKGYEVISYDGNPHNYILSAEKIIQLPYMMYWGLQAQDPAPLFGKSVDVEKFTVRHHPLDNWKSGELRSMGKTEVYVYIVEDQVVGGTSSPVVKQGMAGGYWSLEGKTLEEVQSMDFRTWGEKWRLKYENQNLIGKPPFPVITAGGDKLAVVRGNYCWNINGQGTCTEPLLPRDLLKYVNPTVVATGSKLAIAFVKDPDQLGVTMWIDNAPKVVPLEEGTTFMLPAAKGTYLYTVFARWKEGYSDYVFEVEAIERY